MIIGKNKNLYFIIPLKLTSSMHNFVLIIIQLATTLNSKKINFHQTLSKKIENDKLKFSGNLEFDFISKKFAFKSIHTDLSYQKDNTLILFRN